MSRQKNISWSTGSVMVELTCAFAVASIGIFGIIHVYMQGLEKMRAISEYETALCALSNEIEMLRTRPFDEITANGVRPFQSETPGLERLHRREAYVLVKDADLAAGLKQVTARIHWTGEHGRRITKELTTLIAGIEETQDEAES